MEEEETTLEVGMMEEEGISRGKERRKEEGVYKLSFRSLLRDPSLNLSLFFDSVS